MRLIPLTRLCAALASLLLAAPLAGAASVEVDVSADVLGDGLVLGYRMGDPVPCGAACTYAVASAADMAVGWKESFASGTPQGWPVSFGSVRAAYPSVEDSLAVPAPPAGYVFDAPLGGPLQRAAVDFSPAAMLPSGPRRLSVQTWDDGSGASQTSYAVRIAPTGESRYTFLQFTMPTLQRYWDDASEDQNVTRTVSPYRVHDRAAVEVFVDGVAVWSSEWLHLLAKRYVGNNVPVEQQWGPAINGDTVTLALGRLPTNRTYVATVVFRSDVRVDGRWCGLKSAHYQTPSYNCHSELLTLTLPATPIPPGLAVRPAIDVYTR